MQRVRAEPGMKGLVTANGNYVTKHSAGIYSTDMPEKPFAPVDPATYQAELDQVAHPPFTALAEGTAEVETYTVMHDRKGPTWGLLYGRLDDGTRFIANTTEDPDLLADMTSTDWLGRKGRVGNDGRKNTFHPA